jgi:hypothetical protein
MKGTVVVCLKEMVQKRGSREHWERVLREAGYDRNELFTMNEDVPDDRVTELMGATCKVMGWELQRTFDEFAEYWMCDYGPRIYIAFYDGKATAREFLATMDNVHIVVTNSMANARPPRFTYEWPNPHTMVMHYDSQRGLVDLMISFIKGVGKYYKEPLEITTLTPSTVQIVFPR